MLKQIFFGMIFCAMIFFNCQKVFAEELVFIDAMGDTGYYFDMESVKVQSPEIFFVDFIVIRADKNEMAIANLKINHRKKNYFVQSTKTLSYDERTELKTEPGNNIVRSYSEKSVMFQAVKMILEQI